MRVQIQFATDERNLTLPLEYRKAMLSFLKSALTVYRNGRYFKEFYDVNRPKSFSFAVGLPTGIRFSKEFILLKNTQSKLTLTLSTADMREFAILCNALLETKGKIYPLKDNALRVSQVILLPENQVSQRSHLLLIRMLSPLCVREHTRNHERYVTVEDSDFAEQFNRVLSYQLREHSEWSESDKNSVQLIPYEMKKTVVLHYGQRIACTLGTAVLTASPAVLNYLYQSGMGSRRSAGFGLFEIVTDSEERRTST